MMPSHVRIFWWLSVAIAAYWILSAIWFLAFPTVQHLAALEKLPLEFRDKTRRVEMLTEIISTIIWCAVTLALAWLAAFHRINWSRWVFAAVFIIRESMMFLVSVLYYHQLDFFRQSLAHENWTNPRGYIVPALTIAAIGFVFSGNARSWFKVAAATM
jgi:hypothetical protein